MSETDRRVFRISGAEAHHFLQNLVTNDLDRLHEGPVYAALLTPQGKYRADFMLVSDGEAGILLDVAAPLADDLEKALALYNLRAKVTIERTEIAVARGTGPAPEGAFADPRDPRMGWRAYDGRPSEEGVDWDALRVQARVPASGVELTPDSYILEMGFERLNGVDFRKGCFVGQEVTARMKHKTELKKGLALVEVAGSAEPGTEITRDGKPAGTLFTQAGGAGLAFLRFARAGGEMEAGAARVKVQA
ncbi:folate-binding protein [Roseivivax sp. GX 12232]|uniref:CAF17-like 4Fe-4S cluster assembly/insertion protein YgfZ n=1 Tax=Roseivivax sp. GX 12232 TaxID=2900547 RepID=UPI001E5B38EF|nr:folate-binding protein [Roseivivax sp. GX 12232]MCE0507214.1 folate-binding protein [Roseivivax sp. GX 12232]